MADFNLEQAKSVLSRQLGGVKLGSPDGLPYSQVQVGGEVEGGWQGRTAQKEPFYRLNVSGHGQFDVTPVRAIQYLAATSQDVKNYRG